MKKTQAEIREFGFFYRGFYYIFKRFFKRILLGKDSFPLFKLHLSLFI